LLNLIRDRIRALSGRDQVIEEIDREMRAHVEMQTEANIASGMDPAKARDAAV